MENTTGFMKRQEKTFINTLTEAQAAAWYAEHGWHVFPCGKNKSPLTPHGFKDATRKPESINAWWGGRPDALIGVATGPESGIFVIDIDDVTILSKNERLAALVRIKTPQSKTGKGLHIVFKWVPALESIKTTKVGVNGLLIDSRGKGGYIIAPPSLHPSGVRYQWVEGLSPADVEPAEPPKLVIDMLRGPGPGPVGVSEFSAGLPEAVDWEKIEKDGADHHHRNNTLTRLVGAYFGMGKSPEEILERARAFGARCRPPMEDSEIVKTLESVGRSELVKRLVATGKNEAEAETAAAGLGSVTKALQELQDKRIKIVKGEMPRMVDDAERAIINSAKKDIYSRGASLYRVIEGKTGEFQGVTYKEAGTKILIPVTETYLQDRLNREVGFVKYKGKKEGWAPEDCPSIIARTIIAKAGDWMIPEIRAIVETPTIRNDGTILDEPGYDARTRILFAPNYNFTKISNHPTRKEAEDALLFIRNTIKTFPFATPEDEAVAVAAMITAVIRPAIPTAPLFSFTAPAAGYGKSKFVDAIAIVATGHAAPVIGQGDRDEETEKRLHSALLQGSRIISIDNVERKLKSEALCQIITQTMVRVRILGKSEVTDIPSTATYFATGNNISFGGDMVRRVMQCRMDAGCERPEKRRFETDFLNVVRPIRSELVNACLTITRAYVVAGFPDQGCDPYGSFEEWSKMVRSPVIWLGMSDPCGTYERVRMANPEETAIREVFSAWRDTIGDEAVTVKDVIARAYEDGGNLREALVSVAGRGLEIEPRRLGNWLRKNEDRVIDGARLSREGVSHKVVRWSIT